MKYLLIPFLLLVSAAALADDGGSAVEALSLYDSVFTTESYDWIDTFFERIAAWLVLWWLELKLYTIAFGYDIAKVLIEQLGIIDQIEAAIDGINNQIFQLLDYLNVFEALNIVLSGHAARMVLGLM